MRRGCHPASTELINDIFHCEPATAKSLAELVLTKTGDNPFFIGEFLKFLYAEALVIFNYERSSWQWDLGEIQAQQITDNVVELMVAKVQKLPPQTQAVLKLAACIGSQFSLERLAIVYEKSLRETAVDLWVAISDGFILPLSNDYKLVDLDVEGLSNRVTADYKFAHYRIQQAVYSLIFEAEKQLVHRQVGQQLLQNTPARELEHKLFDVVNHLNFSLTLINQQTERNMLVELNLEAGKKAKASAAYQSAFNYLKVGLELLEETCWQSQYALTLKLYVEAAEAAYLSTDFEEMEGLTEIVLKQAKTLLDKLRVYDVRIQAYIAQNKHLEAVTIGLAVLKFLGVTFPEKPSQADIMLAMQETQSVLIGRQIEELINLPTMTDPVKQAVMKIMTVLWSPAYIVITKLVPLVACKQVSLSLKYGNAPESAFGYANYSYILSASGNIDSGYQFGQLAIRLLEKLNAKKLKAKTYGIYDFVKHLKEALKNSLSSELEVYKSGLENGDFEFAASGACGFCMISYFSGKKLLDLERQMTIYSNPKSLSRL